MPYIPYYQRKPDKPKRDRFDKITLTVAVIGVAVLAVTAGIMLWQTIEITRSVHIAGGQLSETQAEQRPRLMAEVDGSDSIDKWVHNQAQIAAGLILTNYGHSPAVINSITCAPVWVGENGEKPIDDPAAVLASYAQRTQDIPLARGKVIGPSEHPRIQCAQGWPVNDFTSGENDEREKEAAINGPDDIWIIAIIKYTDGTGRPDYSTPVCVKQLSDFEFVDAGGAGCHRRT